jgi:hypothetical protein
MDTFSICDILMVTYGAIHELPLKKMSTVFLYIALSLLLFTTPFANSATLFEHSNSNAWMINAYLSTRGETLPMESWPIPTGLFEKYTSIESNVRANHELLPHAGGKLLSSTSFFANVFPELSANNWSYHPKSKWVDLMQAYRYDSMKPWLTFGYKTSIGDDLYALISIDLRKEMGNYFYKDDATNFPFTKLDPTSLALGFNFPTKGYLSYSNENFAFNLGREQLSWGPMTHGLALSDNSPYYDEASFIYTTTANFCKQFTFTYNMITVDPVLTHEEYEEQSESPDVNAHGFVYNARAKTLVAHRIDLMLWKNFRIGMGELNLIGGKVPDIQDINPFIIWHNTYGEGYSNVLGDLDFDYVPLNGWNLYGEFAVDDVTMPTEAINYKPTAYGYALGVTKNFGNWENLSQIGAEYYYNCPWMYNRWQPYLTFTNRLMRASNNPGSRLFTDYPVGYIYGPDVETLNIFFKHHQDKVNFKAGFNWIKKGSITTLSDYNTNDYDDTTPTGTVEDTKGLYGQIEFHISNEFKLFGSADLRYVTNFRNQDATHGNNPILGNLWLYDLRIGMEYSM